jgi:hypothetical protein
LFLKPTAHIQDIKNQLLREQIDYYTFKQVPQKWVSQLLGHLRTAHVQDAGYSNEQFILTISYILEQLEYCFKTWKILGRFYEGWINNPSNVPDHVGAIIAEDIMTIKMSGPQGDPKRDLEAMIRHYNSGKVDTNTTTTTIVARWSAASG